MALATDQAVGAAFVTATRGRYPQHVAFGTNSTGGHRFAEVASATRAQAIAWPAVNPANRAKLERQIAAVATAALSVRQVVTPIEVLIGVGWLNAADVEAWRRGRVPYLERVATANLAKLSTALRLLRGWADRTRLTPSETVYVAWTRDRHRLRFTKTGDVNIEHAYRTHWISPALVEAKRARQREQVRSQA